MRGLLEFIHALPASGGAKRIALVTLASALTLIPVQALSWPDHTVRIVTPGPPGSGMDAVARSLADGLGSRWGKPVIVENQPGADGILAVSGFLQGQNGHSLLLTTHSTVTVNPLLHEKLPYDPLRDLAPISLAAEDFLAVVASPSVPVNSLTDLVAGARAKPGELNYNAVAGSPYLAFAGFQKHAGIRLTFVPYRNALGALPDLAAGRLHVAVMPLALVLGQARDGKLKALAVTNPQRSPALPDVQTVAEAGFPEFTFGGLFGLFGSKEMSPELRERISGDVRAVLGQPDTAERLAKVGLVARGSTPSEFAVVLDEQRGKWSALANEHGIKPTR